jgi:hypothetical protein
MQMTMPYLLFCMSEISARAAMSLCLGPPPSGEMLEKELHIPLPISLPRDDSGETFPSYSTADEAFPFKISLMRPYPRRLPTNKRRISPNRLSRTRKSVQRSSDILNTRSRYLRDQYTAKKKLWIQSLKHLLSSTISLQPGKDSFAKELKSMQ